MVIPTTMATIPHQDTDSVTPEGAVTPDNASEKKEPYVPDSDEEEEQEGVRQMSAITQTWDKKSLIVVYAFMWLIYFVTAFNWSVTGNLSPYVVSDFEAHSLVTVISIVSSVMGAALYMPIAKMLNLFDRSYGFLVLVFCSIVGLITSAVCKNVQTYAASQVFTTVGFTGMILSIDILTADTSHLRNRGLAYAYTSSPYIITTFAGPKIAEHFHETNWRWAFATVCFMLPVVAIPMFLILQKAKRTAIAQGKLELKERTMDPWTAFKHYVVEFDFLGVFLLAGGLALFLIPFSIAAEAPNGWASGYIIAMLVVGFVMLIAFGFVQRYVSPKPVLPYTLLVSRSVLGACLLDVTYQISAYCYKSYFTSFLQVVFDVSVSQAGYIDGAWDIISGVWLIGVGICIRKTGYFKWLLWVFVPVYILGSGLLIYFRQPHMNVGFIVMCQVFLALGGGTMIVCQQVAVLAHSSHNNAAASLGILGVFGNIGGSVGSAISGAIWTHTLPGALQRLLPADSLDQWEAIYDSLDVQTEYPMGTPIREAIMLAYAETQRNLVIAGTCIMALGMVWVLMIKNTNLAKVEQVKGMLF